MIFTRDILEANEEKFLAPYGFHSKDTRGRLFPEDEAEYRTCFQRDRDRILHTTAFRRLEYKTQVFLNFEGDYYRTRLTHTLEVTQIGRTIARALGANEDMVEAICLAHDMGHPPFGHSGETVLARLMRDYGGFDHNKHSFRIVTQLENRFPDFPGLNLSWEVLEGMVKHETEYDVSDAKGFNPELRGNLEAQITNVADEMAYTAHDLDDGLRSNMITVDQLGGLELWEVVVSSVGWRGGVMDDLIRHRMIRRLIGLAVTDIVNTTETRLRDSGVRSVESVQKLPYNLVGFSEETHQRHRLLKDFLYRHYRVMRMSTKAESIITNLFNAYQAQPAVLPGHVYAQIEAKGLERTICDYIAGMTDRFAVEEHQKMFEPTILP
jgi:dGTPase